jgi:hypothetical protein
MSTRLWYAEEPEAPTGTMVPKSDLIAWFRESARTLKSNPPPEILQPKRAARKAG